MSIERFSRRQENVETGITSLFTPHTRSRGKAVKYRMYKRQYWNIRADKDKHNVRKLKTVGDIWG